MKISLICGSLRKESLNRKLCHSVIAHFSREHTIQLMDLALLKLPVFNEDIESEYKPKLDTFIAPFVDTDFWIVVSPEYNGSISSVLKNDLDWISRVHLQFFAKKSVLMMSASPGGLGGLRGLWHARHTFDVLNAYTHPTMIAIAKAHERVESDKLTLNEKEMKLLNEAVNDISSILG